jgi:hypothetical protein
VDRCRWEEEDTGEGFEGLPTDSKAAKNVHFEETFIGGTVAQAQAETRVE